ncbi:MAG: TIGR03545 family protein [Treponema sp.]|uniref:TIGR03545 family protein n=1 Tax=Treponema sp. TaxID=166 RepID=UPI0025FA89F4|nr:TIGR03545 family protein [Treponema sp.]MBQ8680301.1 TIGR03545 family protein [Treponema sp.]
MKTENEKLKTETKKEKKAKKPEKMLGIKKLPGLFKKSYTQKKFDKLLSKVYVPEDKALIQSMFSEKITKGKTEKLRVPRDYQFPKKQRKSLKLLAKNIKKNKGRIKLLPFIAVVVFIAVIGITVTIFKNPVAKMAIRSTMQGIFGAKCDIESVNVEIFGARLTVRNLAQANADSPMKNIFQFDKLDLDFNLTQLLRARFHAQNIEITGIALNTDRKTSGALPVKPKSAKEKAEKSDSTGFYSSLKSKTSGALDNSKASVAELLSKYDPNTIMANVKGNLKTKEVAGEVEKEIKGIVSNWQEKPKEIQNDVNKFKASSEKLAKLDTKNLKTPQEITDAITSIKSAIDEGKKVKENVSTTLSSFESDKKKADALKSKLDEAIKSDKELIKSQIPDLSIGNAKNVLSGMFDEAGYSVLGKYYPYLKQAISYAGSMKSSNSKDSEAKKESVKKEKQKARKESKRFAGRNVYWRADRVPKLLIEKVHGSGEGIELNITDISSDMDKVGRPMVAKGTYSRSSRTHKAGLTVDARSQSKEPLIKGTYSGDKFPVKIDLASAGVGIPSLSGTTSLDALLTAEADYSFKGSGKFLVSPVTLSSKPISPDFANKIYSKALSSVKKMNVSASVGFTEEKGIGLDISTDADKVLMDTLKRLCAEELDSVKKEALAKASDELNSYTSGALSQFGDLNEIASKLKDSKALTEEVNKQLEAKKKELEKKAKEAGAKKVEEAAGKALGNSGAGKAAGNLMKGLLK